MRVICRGFNTCEDNLDCPHSKPHMFNSCEDECFQESYGKHDCDCVDINLLRRMKLKNIFSEMKLDQKNNESYL